jgi:hypothetical protein
VSAGKALAAGALAAAVAFSIPAVAVGAATPRPRRGLYQCYEHTRAFGSLYSGGFRLVTATRYRLASNGRRWRYRVRGHRLSFVDGPYRSFTGKTRRDRRRRWMIDLWLRSDRSVVQRCRWTHT